MKKKNIFLENKTFLIFGILAIMIALTAIFAPVITRGVDPADGDLLDAVLPPSSLHIFGELSPKPQAPRPRAILKPLHQ